MHMTSGGVLMLPMTSGDVIEKLVARIIGCHFISEPRRAEMMVGLDKAEIGVARCGPARLNRTT